LSAEDNKDLIILTADQDAQFAIQALVGRHAALGIRPISVRVEKHGLHDGAVFKRPDTILRSFLHWRYALVVFDHEGCGHEDKLAGELEEDVERRLGANGWEGRCRAVVIHPELESWVWDSSYQVHRVLRWPGGADQLEKWLDEHGFGTKGSGKPERPKEAFLEALARRRIQRSSAIYRDLAQAYAFRGCQDPAFRRFQSTLQSWFPIV
jgi:hypothetical protein